MKQKPSDFIWPSFTDLMTSLFFVMLVLYVLTFAWLQIEKRVTEQELQKIKQIQNAVSELPDEFFTYQDSFKRFELKRSIEFPSGQSVIQREEDRLFLKEVGVSIQKLIIRLKKKYPNDDIRYLIVIEGMASRDAYSLNYELSYQRALALFRLWEQYRITFDPAICEIQIAGSGTGGVGRYSEQAKNQRFLIQVIPKIGKIESL